MNLPIAALAVSPVSTTDTAGLPQCPDCRELLAVPSGLMATELIECGGCGAELEVMAVDPVLLALAPEIEEDWGE